MAVFSMLQYKCDLRALLINPSNKLFINLGAISGSTPTQVNLNLGTSQVSCVYASSTLRASNPVQPETEEMTGPSLLHSLNPDFVPEGYRGECA